MFQFWEHYTKFPFMELFYRRHFLWRYFICMATKPTAFRSVPPKRLVIYLKFSNFCDHESITVLIIVGNTTILLHCGRSVRNVKKYGIAFCVVSCFEDLETIYLIFPDFFSLWTKIISCENTTYPTYLNFFIDATLT